MWKEEDNQLVKHFEFKDFNEAFGFMTRVAIIADGMQHHPTWENTYNKLTIKLTSHDAGSKVTDKDRELADKIDKL